jgi:hypothetical protein
MALGNRLRTSKDAIAWSPQRSSQLVTFSLDPGERDEHARSDGYSHRHDSKPPSRARPSAGAGPAFNEEGSYVGRVERDLCWAPHGTQQSAFLKARDGLQTAAPCDSGGTYRESSRNEVRAPLIVVFPVEALIASTAALPLLS